MRERELKRLRATAYHEAGQVAEAKFLGRKPRFGMHSDNRRAVDLGMYIATGRTLNAFLHFVFLETQDLVRIRVPVPEIGKQKDFDELQGRFDYGSSIPPSRRGRTRRPHALHSLQSLRRRIVNIHGYI